jgi:hypothetical protein
MDPVISISLGFSKNRLSGKRFAEDADVKQAIA